MNILTSITYYDPYVSGLTLAAERIAEGLKKRGHKVTVLCMRHDRSLPKTENKRGVRIVRADWFARVSKGFVSLDWLAQSWRETEACDVLIVHLPQAEGIIPAILAKFMNKKIIAIYHCEVALEEGFVNGIILSLLEVANMTVMGLADTIVTYTADYARASTLLPHVKKKLTYIVPPVPKPKASSRVTALCKKSIGKAEAVIGVAARLAREKGIEYLLEALPRLPKQTKIVIAGSMDPVGETAYKAQIMNLVKKYKKRVVFLGGILPQEMGSFYKLLDVLVLPSVNSTEAFGFVQVEAMKWGVPVVVTDLPGVRVPVQKTGMGLVVPPGDSKKLATAIRTVLSHRERYIKASAEIETMFSPERSINAFEKILYK